MDKMNEYSAKIYGKIEAVSNEIGYQEKKERNRFSSYNFTSNEQMMAAIRMALKKHKLSLLCDVEDYEERESVNDKGKQVIRSIVRIMVTITDTETGYHVISKGIGAEQDTTGKSMQQAITQAFKYWCFKNFKVSSKMEVDPDAKTTEAAPDKPASTPPKVKQLSKAQILANLAKCKTTACIMKIFNNYGHIDGIKEACTNQKKHILNNSK